MILCLQTLMDTISWTELSLNTLLFLTFASAQIFRLDVQFSAKEKHTKSLCMPKCLLYLVCFFAVLLVCGLLIKFPVEEFIVFVKQKRENFLITCRTILLRDRSLYVDCAWVAHCLLHSRSSWKVQDSSRPTSCPPCREAICHYIRAVLSPARPLCRFTASHYPSAM